MKDSQRFCDTFPQSYNAAINETCDYPVDPDIITGDSLRPVQREQLMNPRYAMKAISGTITNVETNYHNEQTNCIANYDITILTESQQEAHLIISADTYFVDCITTTVGTSIIGFYDANAAMPLIYPPRYSIKVFALNLNNRYIKADFYDCYLISSDQELQLIVSNNTYIISEKGGPYCGNISNKYMIALYDSFDQVNPNVTTPYVIIVLK